MYVSHGDGSSSRKDAADGANVSSLDNVKDLGGESDRSQISQAGRSPNMYWLSNQLLAIARGARSKAIAAKTDQQDWSTDATVAIVFSAAATEGFINELAEFFRAHRGERAPYRISQSLHDFADEWLKIEQKKKGFNRAGIKGKFQAASRHLSGREFDRNSDPFAAFDRLIRLRDDHMHLKPQDTHQVTDAGLHYMKPPDLVQELTDLGLAQKVPDGLSMAWLNRVQTAGIADWACRTALAMILAVLDMFPDDHTHPAFDITEGIKLVFRPDNGWPKPWNSEPEAP
jgi:hypothetical protein